MTERREGEQKIKNDRKMSGLKFYSVEFLFLRLLLLLYIQAIYNLIKKNKFVNR